MFRLFVNIKNLSILGVVVSSALVLSACNLYKPSGNNTTESQPTAAASSPEVATGGVTITFTDSGVEPASLTVKSGQKITWVNNSTKKISVGSAPHPDHTTNQELTNNQYVTALEVGVTATVTLKKIGSWGYHDHLNPSVGGTVIVQ